MYDVEILSEIKVDFLVVKMILNFELNLLSFQNLSLFYALEMELNRTFKFCYKLINKYMVAKIKDIFFSIHLILQHCAKEFRIDCVSRMYVIIE